MATGLVGISFGKNSIVIQPGFPQNNKNEFGPFQFVSKLVTVNRDYNGNYNGSYTPHSFVDDMFEVIIDSTKVVPDRGDPIIKKF